MKAPAGIVRAPPPGSLLIRVTRDAGGTLTFEEGVVLPSSPAAVRVVRVFTGLGVRDVAGPIVTLNADWRFGPDARVQIRRACLVSQLMRAASRRVCSIGYRPVFRLAELRPGVRVRILLADVSAVKISELDAEVRTVYWNPGGPRVICRLPVARLELGFERLSPAVRLFRWPARMSLPS